MPFSLAFAFSHTLRFRYCHWRCLLLAVAAFFDCFRW
jgi:hypothetical protein